jgi:hypothetical protein
MGLQGVPEPHGRETTTDNVDRLVLAFLDFNLRNNESFSFFTQPPNYSCTAVFLFSDQCAAMGTALFSVMPETIHLWCKWHVLRKAPESLGPVYSKNSEFRHQFHKVLNAMLTRDEFEAAWDALIVKYELTEHPFMTMIYECREKWAKPFSNDKFCARMMSTQRVESANHMLKTYVPRNSPMNSFVLQYNNLLFDRAVEEDREEHMTKQVIL